MSASKNNPLLVRARQLPTDPGVYIMKNAAGKVLYVGKAVNLRNRVKSYFMKTGHDAKTEQMVSHVVDFEFYIVASEEEALVLELNLVKKFRPHFNIRLKDDKGFPYLKIDLAEDWPRVLVVRHVASDGARYFGPFANLRSIRHALDVVKSIFPFRTCDIKLDNYAGRPCLEYDMHHCVAPCNGKITRAEYMEIIHELILFLEGRQKPLELHLNEQMRLAAELQQYEKAAWIRDQIKAVQQVVAWQKMAAKVKGDQDVIAFAPDKGQALVQVFFVRGGKLIGREAFTLQGIGEEKPEQIMTDFVQQYYSATMSIPLLILLQHPVLEKEVVQKWLSSRRGKPVVLRVPERGPARELLHTVEENAIKGVEQLRIKNLAQPSALESALAELKDKLGLSSPPARIEGYDISNIQGRMAVGSMVVFEEGKPVPARYRRFRIQSVPQANDYAMLQEVLRRRFSHVSERKDGNSWALPDLVLIDGGKGQLSAAREAMEEAGAQAIATLGLAKENEEIFLPGRGKPISLPVTSPGLQLLQRVRDEAHRFALGYHQNIRKREALTSVLDDVPGIGPHRKRALLKHFGTFQGVKQASVEDLTKVSGITPLIAQKIKEFVG
ncbi:MAG: excinuclease ABC subunit UvrC [Dehalococcoidia bacterium]|nr:MAG: excinuclease ABC subunit UvrC [Dehalococcoidia bacterium]